MRNLLLGSLLLLTLFAANAQNTSTATTSTRSPIEHVVDFGNRLPHEKVYLHLDNNCYFMGDTIWYKAYVTRSDNNKLTDISKILYVELFTPDGFMVERQQIPLSTSGNGFGAFALQDSLYSGFYELRAYTRWQLNFGGYQHEHAFRAKERFYTKGMANAFFRDYEKLYTRVFPVYDKPKNEGEYNKLMTTRPLRRYFSNDKVKEELKTTFFPEGGNLVAGLNSRVAFECIDHEGKHNKAEGVVRNQSGEEVAKFATSFRGRGVFELPASAKSGDVYTAVIEWKGEKYTYKLPEVRAAGCVISVTDEGENIKLDLATKALDPASAATLQASVMCGGKVSGVFKIELDGNGQATQLIGKDKLRTGVNNITVFDEKGEIFADRLFFINHLEYDRAKLQVRGLKEEYAPHEAIELTLQLKEATEAAEISVAIRDQVTDEPLFDNSTILTEMLLGSEVKGFIESPAYYFEADDEPRRAHLDILLLVQGWRRYVWRDMAGINGFGLSHLPEKFQTLEGSVHRLFIWQKDMEEMDAMAEYDEMISSMEANEDGSAPASTSESSTSSYGAANTNSIMPEIGLTGRSNLKHEVDVTAEFVVGGEVELNDQTTKEGFFKLMVPPFFGESITFLSGVKEQKDKEVDKKKRLSKAASKLDEEGIPEFYIKRDLFYPLFVKPYSYYQENMPEFVSTGYGAAGTATSLDDMQWLDEVTIRTKRQGLRKVDYSKPAFVIDAYQMYNNVVDYGLSCSYFYGGREFDMTTTTEQVFGQMGFYDQIAYAVCADMGRERNYFVTKRIDGKAFNNIRGQDFNPYNFGKGEIDENCRLRRMDKIYIYTDYEPRHEGSWRYEGSNQPEVVVDIKLFEGGGKQPTYKDRRYVLPGYTDCAEFYNPDYSQAALPDPKDYRRTLYWNPVVKTDAQGKATVKFHNNAKGKYISVSAEGITPSGIPVVME